MMAYVCPPFQAVLEHPEPARGQVRGAGRLGDAEQHVLHPRLLRLHAPPLPAPTRQQGPLLVARIQASLN